MKSVIVVLSLITIAIAFVLMVRSLFSNHKFSKNVACSLMLSMLASIFYLVHILSPVYSIGMVFAALWLASIDWILFIFLNFSFDISASNQKGLAQKVFRIAVASISVVDGILLLTNVFFETFFSIAPILADEKFYCWNMISKPPLAFHFSYCYIFSLLIIVSIAKRIFTSEKIYRRKYFFVLILFVSSVLSNVFFMLFRDTLKFNLSFFIYPIASFVIYYFSFVFLPNEMDFTILSLVSEDSANGIICFDANRNCIYINNLAKELFRTEAEIRDELRLFADGEADSMTVQKEFITENRTRIFSESFKRFRDKKMRETVSYLKFDDVTEAYINFEEEKFRVAHDVLTGLYNRNGFFNKVCEVIETSPDVPRYFLGTNIRNFKLINDLFGTEVADELLLSISRRFFVEGQEGCVVGRISGDKFAMLIPKEYFTKEFIEKNLKEDIEVSETIHYKVQFLVGVYEVSDPRESVKLMYDKANLAIKTNRHDYEQVVYFYDTSIMEKLVNEKQTLSLFNQALEKEEFCMYLQPQVLSTTEKVIGAEALVRWNHPVRGLIYPSSFVQILEASGDIYRLDEYIWRAAAALLADWKMRGIDKYIAVNISGKDFFHFDLFSMFTGLVSEYGIEPRNLKLEITETILMRDMKMHSEVLGKLQDFGFQIEMDDFGSAYSSLNALSNIKVDVIKIDSAFLKKTDCGDRDKIILKSVIAMAKKLNIRTVSEGVETKESADFLKNEGCDIFQGYYYSKPIPVAEFEQKYNGEGN